jgi:hypothetical protein
VQEGPPNRYKERVIGGVYVESFGKFAKRTHVGLRFVALEPRHRARAHLSFLRQLLLREGASHPQVP